MKATIRGWQFWLFVLLFGWLHVGTLSARSQTPQQPGTVESEARTKALREMSVLYSQTLSLELSNQYDEAIPIAERILTLSEKTYGANDGNVAMALIQLARLYDKKRAFDRAEPLNERALAIGEQAYGANNPNLLIFLNPLADVYRHQGSYDRAELLYRRALAIAEKASGPDDPSLSTLIVVLADVCRRKAEYDCAERLLQRAVALNEKAGAADQSKLIAPLDSLASLYVTKGDYGRADQLLGRALALREKNFGVDHPLFAVGLVNAANSYQEQGEYVRAEQYLQRALPIFEKSFGPDDPSLATLFNNMAELYDSLGDLDRAETLSRRALEIDEKAFGSEHLEVASGRYSLASRYVQRGDYARAEPLFQSSLALWEKLLRPDHPKVAEALSALAVMYDYRGEYARAEPLHLRALAIKEKALGPFHPEVGTTLNNIAAMYQGRREYARAEPFYQRALAIHERTLGAQHSSTALLLNNMAIYYEAKGDAPRALQLAARGADISEYNLALILTTGSERRKLLYTSTLAPETNYTVSLHFHALPTNADAARLSLTTILRRKGRALDAMSDQIGALRRRLNKEDQQLLDQLSTALSQLASLTLGGVVGRVDPAQHEAAINRLKSEIERLQAQVSGRSAEFRAGSQPVAIERVQGAIPSDAALVEFVSYRPVDVAAHKLGAAHYAAYVVHHEGALRWVDLGEAAPIDAGVTALRGALSNPQRRDVRQHAQALEARVMRPVRALLGDAHMIFIAPDSQLNLIPFGALVDEQNKYLLEHYTITYLTSGRDLLRLQVHAPSRQESTLFANPLFDADSNVHDKRDQGEQSKRGGQTIRRSGDLSEAKFNPLPGTAQEAEALTAILSAPRVYTKAQATEAALKRVTAPRILHVATHGFFLPDQLTDATPQSRGLSLVGETRAEKRENPLLRSGLALAGANTRQSDEGEDGILTALEVAGLDLWGTKLVVLSACETGIGKIENGDGVYGLRRALVLAGSESQVLSLWKVSDAATRDLMVGYYQRLQAGEGRTEALRKVQLEMLRGSAQGGGGPQRGLGIQETNGRTDYRHPFYWAAFIQSGDWHSMSEPSSLIRRD